jgi:hypothetical protein
MCVYTHDMVLVRIIYTVHVLIDLDQKKWNSRLNILHLHVHVRS